MSIQYCSKNKNYIISKKNYNDDYSFVKSNKIDMTLSGRYLYKYPFKTIYKKNLDKYPSKENADTLIQEINKKYNLNNKNKEIIIGPGTNGIIQNIIKILFTNNNKYNLITPYYSFEQAEYCVTSYNGYTKRIYCNNYKIDYKKITESIDNYTKLVYICNPNNPTGIATDNKEIIKFVQNNKNTLILLDESNIEYSNCNSILEENITKLNNLIVIKSFSKAYGLANLRIGYIVCSKKFSATYKNKITTHEFSGISCILATKVLKSNYYKKNVKKILKEKNFLEKELKKLNIDTIKSESNTLMTKTTFSKEQLNKINLLNVSIVEVVDKKQQIHIRIAVQDHKTNLNFLKVMKMVMKNEK